MEEKGTGQKLFNYAIRPDGPTVGEVTSKTKKAQRAIFQKLNLMLLSLPFRPRDLTRLLLS
jgi:hypothetical protein